MKILVIDDESVRALLSKVLVNYSHTVVVATDGQAGFDLATTYAYDLIISNVSLPQLDGINLSCRSLNGIFGRVFKPAIYLCRKSSTFRLDAFDICR
jgi:DNA-binding response OmpR family regulator